MPKPIEGVIFSQPWRAWPVKLEILCIWLGTSVVGSGRGRSGQVSVEAGAPRQSKAKQSNECNARNQKQQCRRDKEVSKYHGRPRSPPIRHKTRQPKRLSYFVARRISSSLFFPKAPATLPLTCTEPTLRQARHVPSHHIRLFPPPPPKPSTSSDIKLPAYLGS